MNNKWKWNKNRMRTSFIPFECTYIYSTVKCGNRFSKMEMIKSMNDCVVFFWEFQSDKMNLQIKHISLEIFEMQICFRCVNREILNLFFFSHAHIHTMEKRFCKPIFRLWHVKLNLINLSISTLFYISPWAAAHALHVRSFARTVKMFHGRFVQ